MGSFQTSGICQDTQQGTMVKQDEDSEIMDWACVCSIVAKLMHECFFHLNKLLEFSLDLVQSADVLPVDLRHLCNRLSQSWWVALT